MKRKYKIIISFLVLILTFSLGYCVANKTNNKSDEKEAYIDQFTRLDYSNEVVYCIGHKSPDLDTVASSIAMANLLNNIGIKAEPRVTGTINSVTRYILETNNIDKPKVLEDASNKQLWLVDHSTLTQAVNGIDKARIVGISDHHNYGGIETSEAVNINVKKTVSCATTIYSHYKECGVEINQKIAALMLAAIIDDSGYLTDKLSELDKIAYNELLKISKTEDVDSLISKMKEVAFDFTGLSDKDIYYLNYKDYAINKYQYEIGVVTVAKETDVEPMANRMNAFLKEEVNNVDKDFLVYLIKDGNSKIQYCGFVSKDEKLVSDIVNNAFNNMKELKSINGNEVVISPALARKNVNPYIINYLNQR